jgi:5-oxopent-3-ene-1,2,5-tricarboxylate decarboxylase/2-hydroxyhepta-2,4-diene-1,7-dioate isomerase
VGATVGVVFGRDVARIAPADLRDAIEGYVLAADLSLPHTSYYRPAIREKCFDGACPLGAVVPAQVVGQAGDLTLHTSVDGRRVESRCLAELVRDVPTLVADVSAFMTLQRGDVLLIGVRWQAAQAGIGAWVRVEAERLGSVEFQLAAAREVQA